MVICVSLNYKDRSVESGYRHPNYSALFARFSSGLIGYGEPLRLPCESEQFDSEDEMLVVISTGDRCIPKAQALDHVCAYSIFNDGWLRDFQHHTSQWTIGKTSSTPGYSYDVDFIPASADWPAAANHDGEDAFYTWRPTPRPEFTVGTELG